MKSFSKFSFHPLTLAVWGIGVMTGYFKYIMAIFGIVFVHELGHVLFARIFKRKIVSVKLLPFGGLTHIDGRVSENIFEDLLIASGGICLQVILGWMFIILHKMGHLDEAMFRFLNTYNIFIITFNLLPICPLDGYKMARLFFEIWTPYKMAYVFAVSVSVIFLSVIAVKKWSLCQSNFMVVIFLVWMLIEEVRLHKYACIRFYVERMNSKFNYARKDVASINAMFKNRVNFIAGVHEKDYLRVHFTPKSD